MTKLVFDINWKEKKLLKKKYIVKVILPFEGINGAKVNRGDILTEKEKDVLYKENIPVCEIGSLIYYENCIKIN